MTRSAHRPLASARRGVALLVTLITCAILAVLCTAALAAGVQSTRNQARERAERATMDLAESALTGALDPDRRASLLALVLGDRVTFDTGVVAPGAHLRARTTVVRFSPSVLWLVGDAVARSAATAPPIARRRVGLLVTERAPPLPPDAALVSAGAVSLAGTARVDGAEAIMVDACASDPPGVPGPGALLASGAGLTVSEPATIDGTPPATHDSLVAGALADSLARWLDALLAATPPPLIADTLGALTPVVRVAGDLVAPHGVGSGVLIVDGDLSLDGDFAYQGVIAVRGTVRMDGAGVELRGALIALGAGPHVIGGDARVLRSRCAVRRALAALAVLEPLRERAWSEVW